METIIRAATLSAEPMRLSSERRLAPAGGRLQSAISPASDERVAQTPESRTSSADLTPADTAASPLASPSRLSEADLKALYHAELQQFREQAERQGYAAGLEKANAISTKIIKEHVDRLTEVISQVEQAHQAMLTQAQSAALEIAYAAVCKLISAEATSRDAIIGCVNQAVAGYRERNALTIRLNPQDFQLIQSSAGEVLAGDSATLIADSDIRYGGCIVETPVGALDAQLDIQLEELRDTLLAVRRSRSANEQAKK